MNSIWIKQLKLS